uniref:ATP synthase complex subunit 8 n=1 Tax=Amblypharyngodon chulabhornae TaxID=38661 RepID=A0A1Q2TAB9_AMBCH|nr:ATPase subunit 8 [Amblypharyngodon chulabhornae]
MPQLNPLPWFSIMLFSWFILIVFMPTKVLSHVQPNDFIPMNAKLYNNLNWNWPW